MKTAIILTLAAVCLFNAVQSKNCGLVIAPDGSTYDLSGLSNVFVTPTQPGPEQYSYNISICGSLPAPCGNRMCAQPGSAGICQTWPNGGEKCFGQKGTRYINPLPEYAGVVITLTSGDYCGSCNPSSPRTSIITLICTYKIKDKSEIQWVKIEDAQPTAAPVSYFTGLIGC